MTEHEPSFELPAFDERETRRAVRRAVWRTARLSVLSILLALVVVQGASIAWTQRDIARFRMVMWRAYQVANPAYLINDSGYHPKLNFGTHLLGSAQAWEANGFASSSTPVTIHRNVLGRVGSTRLPDTRLSELFCCADRSLAENGGLAAIEDLPAATVLSAVIELKEPMTESAFTTFRRTMGVCATTLRSVGSNLQQESDFRDEESLRCRGSRTADLTSILVDPTPQYRAQRENQQTIDGSHRISWPSPTLDGFKAWARALRPSDEPNLKTLFLQDVAEIKRRAAEGKVYGFVATRLRPERVRALLNAPEVADIEIGDVGLAVV